MHSGQQILIDIMDIMQRYSSITITDCELKRMYQDVYALILKHSEANDEQRRNEKSDHVTDDSETG